MTSLNNLSSGRRVKYPLFTYIFFSKHTMEHKMGFFVLKLWQRQTTFFFCIKRKAYGLQTCIALLPCCFFLVRVDLSQGSSVKSACSEKLFVIHRCLGVAKLKLKHARYSVMFIRSNFAQLKYTIVYTWIVLSGIQHDKIQGSFFTESFWRKKKRKRFGLILVNTTWKSLTSASLLMNSSFA